jgi:hypothetical protein
LRSSSQLAEEDFERRGVTLDELLPVVAVMDEFAVAPYGYSVVRRVTPDAASGSRRTNSQSAGNASD